MSEELERYKYIGQVLENIHPSLTIVDKNGVFVFIADSCKTFFGEEIGSFYGMNVKDPRVSEVFHPCVSKMVMDTKKKMTITQKNNRGETTFVTGIPIFNNNNALELIISFSSWDVSNYDDLKTHFEQIKEENECLIKQINSLTKEENLKSNLISESRSIQNILRLLKTLSEQNISSFVYGPIGCGKSYLSKSVYGQDGLVYEYNCELMSQEKIELDLFGNNIQQGILDSKGYRTLLIYHIEQLYPALQHRLIEKIKYTGISVIGISVSSLDELKENKYITDEFYYYFKSYQVAIPCVSDRPEDLQRFLEYYINKYNSKYNKNISFSPRAMNCLLGYEWKENINEINYTVERLILTAETEKIDIHNLPEKITKNSTKFFLKDTSLKDLMEFYEKQLICRAYEKYHTTVEVAKRLNISQATAVRKIGKYVDEK